MPSKVENPIASDKALNIAIIGSGIGGLSLAIGLLAKDIPCTIYEAAPQFSAVGAGIGLGPNALQAINLIDARFGKMYDSIKTGNKTPERVHDMFEALLAEEGFGSKNGWKGGSVGAEYFQRSSAHRKDLLDIMASFIPKDVVKFNKRVTSLSQTVGRVKVTFSDDESVEVDTVIGCDGIKGISRNLVLGDKYPERVASQYSGSYVYRAVVPMEVAEGIIGDFAVDAKWYMTKGRSLASYPISKGKEMNYVCFIQDKNPWTHEQATLDVTMEEMVADLEGFDSRLMKLLDFTKPQKWPLFHHKDTPTYYNGNICLLGDSAHATTPWQAAGAGQALEDSLILSTLLGLVESPNQLEVAFRIYDSIRRPRANRVVQSSEEAGLVYCQYHPETGADMEKIVANGNARVPWIWTHDLTADVEIAKATFKASIAR